MNQLVRKLVNFINTQYFLMHFLLDLLIYLRKIIRITYYKEIIQGKLIGKVVIL